MGAPSRAPRPAWFYPALVAIALVGLALRIVYAYDADRVLTQLGDADWYHAMGNQIADHLTFHKPFAQVFPSIVPADPAKSAPTAWHPPLFPMVLAAASKLGLSSFRDHEVVACVLGAGGVVLTGMLGRELGGPWVGVVAAAFAAVSVSLIANDALLLSEALYAPLVTLTLLLVIRAVERPETWRLATAGAVAALATLARADGTIICALLVVAVALVVPTHRLRSAAILAAGVVVVLSPWVVRNVLTFDKLVTVSNSWPPAVLGANCPSTYYGPLMGSWDGRCVARTKDSGGLVLATVDAPDEGVQASNWLSDGVDYAKAHKGRAFVVMLARPLRTWQISHPRQEEELNIFLHVHIRSVERIATIQYALLALLSLLGMWALRRRRAALVIVVVPFVAVTLTSMASFGETRFRAGVEPLLCVLAALGAAWVVERVARRGRAPAAGA